MKFIFLFLGLSAAAVAHAQKLVPVLVASNQFQYQDAASGSIAFNTVFETATPFQNGIAVVSRDHHYQLINTSGNPLTTVAQWSEIKPAPGGYAIAYSKQGSKALLQGETKIFETNARLLAGSLQDDFIHFQDPETGKMGIVNFRTGKESLPARYDFIRPFNDGVAAAAQGGAWQLIDISGKPVATTTFEDVGVFAQGVAPARQGGRWGVIDAKGKWTLPAQYDRITEFAAGTAFAQSGEVWKQIGKTGNIIRELPYQMIIAPTEGLYAFMQNNLWGFASAETGQIVIAPQYLRAASFDNGLAWVARNGMQFYILPDGTELRTHK